MREMTSEKKALIIFGNGHMSSLAWYCITHDSQYTVEAFTVDQKYMDSGSHEGLPVVSFEQLEDFYSPSEVSVLVALGFHNINGLRRSRYESLVSRGYSLASYISSRASVWNDFQVRSNCMIYEEAAISPFARVGENVVIRSNVYISHHCVIGDHSFVAAGATLGGGVVAGEQTFIGLGAVVRDGIRIAERSFIGAGAVVISDTEPDGVYFGNPARKIPGELASKVR